jgi:hypothetical protein
MKRISALCLLFIMSIAGIILFLWGIDQIQDVYQAVVGAAGHVVFENRIGLTFSGLLLPILLVVALCDMYLPEFAKKHRSFLEKITALSTVLLIGGGIFFSFYLQSYVSRSGYQYCGSASGTSAVMKTVVYTQNDVVCQQLTEARRSR